MIGRATETIRKWTDKARAAPVPGLPMVFDLLEWAYDRAVQGLPGLEGAEQLAADYAGTAGQRQPLAPTARCNRGSLLKQYHAQVAAQNMTSTEPKIRKSMISRVVARSGSPHVT